MILRDYCVDWIIGWVACWIAFMYVFFILEKLVLKYGSTPCCLSSFFSFFLSHSRQLLDTWWIDRESSCLLDSFSTLGGSIELLFLDLMSCSSIPAQYLSCRWPFPWYLPRSLLRYLSTPASIELYWGSLYSFFAIRFSFLQSLSICPHLFIS